MPEVRVPMTIEEGHTSLKYASHSCRILSMRSKSLVYYLFCIVLNLLFLYINFLQLLVRVFWLSLLCFSLSVTSFLYISHTTQFCSLLVKPASFAYCYFLTQFTTVGLGAVLCLEVLFNLKVNCYFSQLDIIQEMDSLSLKVFSLIQIASLCMVIKITHS